MTSKPDKADHTLPARVLFVDDEPMFLQMLETEFRRNSIEIIPASNGVEALFELSTTTKPIDLVVTDFRMPEMDGLSLIKKLYSPKPLLPIIFCSSYLPDECLDEVRRLSREVYPVRYLEKPISIYGICQMIREDIHNWKTWLRS